MSGLINNSICLDSFLLQYPKIINIGMNRAAINRAAIRATELKLCVHGGIGKGSTSGPPLGFKNTNNDAKMIGICAGVGGMGGALYIKQESPINLIHYIS